MDILIYGIPAAAIVMAITQIAKKFITDRWIPVVAVIAGMALVILANTNNLTDITVVIGFLVQGAVVGLAACGLWDTGKITVLNK